MSGGRFHDPRARGCRLCQKDCAGALGVVVPQVRPDAEAPMRHESMRLRFAEAGLDGGRALLLPPPILGEDSSPPSRKEYLLRPRPTSRFFESFAIAWDPRTQGGKKGVGQRLPVGSALDRPRLGGVNRGDVLGGSSDAPFCDRSCRGVGQATKKRRRFLVSPRIMLFHDEWIEFSQAFRLGMLALPLRPRFVESVFPFFDAVSRGVVGGPMLFGGASS